MIKTCQNPQCAKEYKTDKATSMYCSVPCRHTQVKRRYADEQIANIQQWLLEGQMMDVIAARFGITDSALRKNIAYWSQQGFVFTMTYKTYKQAPVGEIRYRKCGDMDRRAYIKTADGWKPLPLTHELNAHYVPKQRVKKLVPPKNAQVPIGTIRYRKETVGIRAFEKQGEGKAGWVRLPIDHPMNIHAQPKTRRPAEGKLIRKTTTATTSRPAKRMPKEVRRLPTRTIDLSTKQPVYIPSLRMTVYANPGADVNAIREKYMNQHRYEMTGR